MTLSFSNPSYSMDPYIMNRVWTSPFPRVPIAITPSLSELSSAPLSSTPSSASSSTYPVTPSAALRPFGVEYEAYMTLLTCALILIVWVGGVILWYLYCIRRPPRLFRGRGHLIRAVTDDCPSLQRPYCPPIWCISPWAQAGVSLQRTTSIRAQLCQLVGEDAWDADQEETAGTEEAGEARVEEREEGREGGRGKEGSRTVAGGGRERGGEGGRVSPPPGSPASSDPATPPLPLPPSSRTKPPRCPSSRPPPSSHPPSNDPHPRRRRMPSARYPLRRELVTLRDQQQIYLHWYRFSPTASSPPTPRAVTLLLHGVTGNTYDHYELAERLAGAGILAVGFDRRGHGGLRLQRPRFNTTGDQEDLKEVIDIVRGRHSSLPLFAVGYSAGSSLLGRYLGEQGDDSHIDGAVLVSPGFDMEEAILMGHLHPLADYYLTQVAKNLFLEGLGTDVPLSKRQDLAVRRLKSSRSMREFHAELHPFSGHESAEEYFKANNPAPLLKDIARPTLFINSHDDMMFPKELIRQWTWLADANENIAMVQTRWGGHCCFYEGPLSLQPVSWAERVVEEFLAALALRPCLPFARRAPLPPSLPPSLVTRKGKGEEGEGREEEGEDEEEMWIQRSLSSTSSTASYSSWTLSSPCRSRAASSPPSLLLPLSPPCLPLSGSLDGHEEGGNEDGREEGKKEEVKRVFCRAAVVGWLLTFTVAVGLMASQPLLPLGATM